MPNMVYGNPYGAALEGKRAALDDILKAGTVARQQRGEDLDYGFRKWYDPLRRDEAQSKTAQELLHNAAMNARYTGDYRQINGILQQYYGQAPSSLPPGFEEGKGTANQTKAADLAFGNLPIPLSYPGVFAAGGAAQALPTSGAASADPELDALRRALTLKQYHDALNPPTAAPMEHLNPLGGIPNPTALSGVGDAAKPPTAASLYGIPPTQQAAPEAPQAPKEPSSIWHDEYEDGTDGQ